MTPNLTERYGNITPYDVLMIRATALFDGYSPLELTAALENFGLCLRKYKHDEVIAHEGEQIREVAIVLSGYLHVYDSAYKGERHLTQIARPGQVLGATLIETRLKNYPALVKAYGKVTLAVFPMARIRAARRARSDQRFFDNLGKVLCDKMQEAWHTMAILSCNSIADRIMLFLNWRIAHDHSKTILIGATEEQFANFMGATRSAYVRVLRKLMREGKVSCSRGKITLNE